MIPVEISIITIEPAIIQAYEKSISSSSNFFDWLKLLGMFKHNQLWKRVDQCIKDINNRFIVKESFWIKELEEHWNRIDYEDSQAVNQFWELMKSGFSNESRMPEFGERLCSWIINVYKNIKKFTLKQAELKIEWLVQRFRWDIERGAIYYEKFRELYPQDQITKIRSVFHEEFKNPFNSNDVMFDQYKSWETDSQQIDKANEYYQKSLEINDNIRNSIENQHFYNIPVPLALSVVHGDSQYNEREHHEIIKRETQSWKRAQLLKREAKESRLEAEYLEELERSQSVSEEELIQQYQIYIQKILVHASSQKIQSIVKKYIASLVRRINKHLTSTQSQQYLNSWGEKVTFLRQQIMRLIPKIYKGVQTKLYKYWANIETYVIKDATTACSVFQELVKNKLGKTEFYIDYGHSLVVLGNVAAGIQILKKGIENCEDNNPIKQKLRGLIELFGNIEEIKGQQEDQKNVKNQGQIEDIQAKENKQEREKKQGYQKKKEPNLNLDFVQKRKHNQGIKEKQDDTTVRIITQETQRHHSDSGKTLFLKGVPDTWDKSDVLNLFDDKEEVADVRIVNTHKKRKTNNNDTKYTNVCYVDMVSLQAAEKAIKNNRRKDITMELSRPPRQDRADDRTVLFAGLSPESTVQDIKEFLKQYEGLEAVRLLENAQGSRGIAFVQFNTLENYQTAWTSLIKRKLTLKQKGFTMRQCDNQRVNTKNMSTVVFLEGLAYKADDKDIEKFFKDKGISNIKEIEIARNDQQKSKGFAYVEFAVFKDYQKALDLECGNLFNREFKIKKSDRKITQKKAQKQDKQRSNTDFLKLFK